MPKPDSFVTHYCTLWIHTVLVLKSKIRRGKYFSKIKSWIEYHRYLRFFLVKHSVCVVLFLLPDDIERSKLRVLICRGLMAPLMLKMVKIGKYLGLLVRYNVFFMCIVGKLCWKGHGSEKDEKYPDKAKCRLGNRSFNYLTTCDPSREVDNDECWF